MAITNYQGGADTIFDYRNINRVAERELARKATVAQAKAKTAEDQAKEIAGMLAKINPDGLRDADIGEFSQKYGEVQTFAAEMRAADTIEKRATASAKFNQGVQGLGLFINSSKNEGKDQAIYLKSAKDNVYRTSDEQRANLSEMVKMPTSKSRDLDKQKIFKLGVRPEHMMDVDKTIELALTKAASNSRKQVEIGTIRANGVIKKQFQDQSTVTPEQAYAGYIQGYDSDPEYRDGINQQAQQLGLDVNTFLQQKATRQAPLLGERGATTLSDFTPAKSSGSGEDDKLSNATYRQQVINRVANKEPEAVSELLAYLPEGSIIKPSTSIAVEGKSKGGYNAVRIEIPDQNIFSKDGKTVTTVLGIKKDVSLSKGDYLNEINSILNTYSNTKNVDAKELNIVSGKKAGKEFNVKAPIRNSQGNKPKLSVAEQMRQAKK
jgi:hypothetical protein